VNALTSHCDSGPASIPIRLKGTPSEVKRAMISAGSSAPAVPRSPRRHHRQRKPTFLSPTHQDPRNAPSHPSFLHAPPRTHLDPFIVTEGDARSASKAEPQTPRYTILRR